jgi:hypothetical protein
MVHEILRNLSVTNHGNLMIKLFHREHADYRSNGTTARDTRTPLNSCRSLHQPRRAYLLYLPCTPTGKAAFRKDLIDLYRGYITLADLINAGTLATKPEDETTNCALCPEPRMIVFVE